MDTLVILMVAFGLFAVAMFVLFYIYAKKYYNEKHLTEDYKDDSEDNVNVEVIDVQANGNTYTFDADGKYYAKDQVIRLLIDGNYVDAVVTHTNYMKNYTSVNDLPKKVVLEEKKEIVEEVTPVENSNVDIVTPLVTSSDNEEFIPVKKQ